jgi:hypothetical protein
MRSTQILEPRQNAMVSIVGTIVGWELKPEKVLASEISSRRAAYLKATRDLMRVA